MAQFDVHRNTGKHRDSIPYVVVVQSSLYDDYRRRIVVPLVRKTEVGRIGQTALNPGFKIEGVAVLLHPLEIVSVAVDDLGEKVGSLNHEGERIMAALDELLTQAWK